MGLIKAKAVDGEVTLFTNREVAIDNLRNGSSEERRKAVNYLSGFSDMVKLLCDQVAIEQDPIVREMLITRLIKVSGHDVVAAFLPHLSSENAALRNEIIDALKLLKDETATFIANLLADPDPDVRIMTINILEGLPNTDTCYWLQQIITQDPHVNVCATALDLLAELANPTMIPALMNLKERFKDIPYISFTVDLTLTRLQG